MLVITSHASNEAPETGLAGLQLGRCRRSLQRPPPRFTRPATCHKRSHESVRVHAEAAARPSPSAPAEPAAVPPPLPPLCCTADLSTPHTWPAPARQLSAVSATAAPPVATDVVDLAATAAAAAAAAAARAGGGAAAAEQQQAAASGVSECWWLWHGRRVRYLRSGTSGPAVVCVHGFCANADHWRHNLPALGQHCRAFALDLLGFGYSDKRCPLHRREPLPAATSSGEAGLFTFHTWSRQLRAFIQEVVREPAVLLCNSAGGEVGLQAAIDDPSLVRAVQLFDISLRCQHEAKQAAWQRPFMAAAQRLLHETPLGLWYFAHLANRQTVRSLLCRCYGRPEAVTEELVESLVAPARQPGAAQVFLECICNSRGPLPEEQLQAVRVPVGIVWGEADPWERVELGRQLAQYPSVESFVALPGVGHCPQDEAPDLVNPLMLDFIRRHAEGAGAAA